jgi:DNA-binding ferritin-like protein (Dps family)
MPDSPFFQMMKQTELYQRILGAGVKVGELKELRELLFLLGSKRFGAAGHAVRAVLELIQDVETLESLCDRMIDPERRSWDDLFRESFTQPHEPDPSTTCEAILREGREIGRFQVVRRVLRRVGAKRFGEPIYEISRRFHAIQDIDRLEALVERLLDDDLKTWTDLLGEESA